MAWYAVYRVSDGRLESLTTAPPTGLTAALASKVLTSGPDVSLLWDETVQDWKPRPAETLLDRVQDLVNDPGLAAAWSRLTTAQRQALRDRLVTLLGPRRWRSQVEPVDLEA